ncbi:hypothetical protein MK079_00315 [Candidatus Gracilibacteria bacterium]|nr:hypothetical protein [Candidatus Gracilibacteria bacterium]
MKINSIKNGIIFGLSASLTMILVGITYAAWNDVINSGDPLTATAWNDLVAKVSELNNFSFNSGNIGIGNVATEKFDIAGIFKVDTDNNEVQTSQYVREFSGIITGPNGYPACDQPTKIVTLGTINDSPRQSFIEVELYGSHRGYTNTNYFDYEKWVIMAGDKVSSANVASGGTSARVSLYDGADGNYYNEEIGSGFDIRLSVDPYCGAGMSYTYVVRYYSNANFSPHPTRSW